VLLVLVRAALSSQMANFQAPVGLKNLNYEHRRAERGARPIYFAWSLRFGGGGATRGAWPGEVAVTKLVQGANPIPHTPLLLLPSRSLLRLLPCHTPQPPRACVAPPPLVPPRPSPDTPPPLLGTTPCHLYLLDRRLLHCLLSGTTPRYLCLLDRRLLHRLLSGTALRRLCLPGQCLLRRPFPYSWWGRRRTAIR
jgi:hypothetical protein